MRSVLQALIVKTFLLQFSLFHVSVDSTNGSVMKGLQGYDATFELNQGGLTIRHEEHSSQHSLDRVMKAHSPSRQRDLINYPSSFTELISLIQRKIHTHCRHSSRFTTESMWTILMLIIAYRAVHKCSISSELQFLSLIFVQMESTIATVAPSLSMTSSSHVMQSTVAISNVNYYNRGDCDLGWYQFGKYCYLPANEPKTFNHAQRACAFHNANLMSISSQEENAIAFNISKVYLGFPYTNFLWIGMERRQATRRLHWIDGIDLNYQNWIIGEPDSNGACVQMIEKGLWEDTNCFHKIPFICKKRSSYPRPYTRATELGIMVGIPFTFVFIVLTFVGILIYKSIKDADDTFYGYGKNRNKEKMHAALINLSASIAHVSSQVSSPERRQVTTPRKGASRSNSRSQSISSSHVNPAIEVSDFGSQSPIEIRKESGSQSPIRKESGAQSTAAIRKESGPQYPIRKDSGYQPPIRKESAYQSPIRKESAYKSPIRKESAYQPSIEIRKESRTNTPRGIRKESGYQSPVGIRRGTGNGRAIVDNNNRENPDPEEIEMQVCVSSISIEKEHPLESATSLDHLVTLKPKSRRLKGLRKPEATVRPPGKEGMYRLKTYV